ncbi:nitrogenase iron protein [Sporobacter termitidis DSM 10068]|uniref:nitrogenase n=1 Tax=Sporobacter termitidis DSM 10068 TaxID=1123282 RepID=A0A1M5YRL3_9FIRM|nr:nitrogenase component 1 [Sporobacter termitidis]SHI14213.1 nitrogenase iron protein [Sporobacter termitidis DSM 10068]
MKEIAVYGKGGIGKSTLSANLSAALAQAGKRVLQIGCDPKHDSTRLLTHGHRLTTVLDYMRVTNPLDYKLEDILLRGYADIGCVEAGGPKPGVGCAGRGIISTFELLNQFKLKEHYDITVYDVLGDVVCGGFAVPIRREYADTIFVVTSGEFMALYAANNILRGIRNYDNEERRVAGILYNKRNVEDEDERVVRFARAVGLPICAIIPRSDAFTRAERANMTVVEQAIDRGVIDIFSKLAQEIMAGCTLYEAKPLSDEQLESVVLGREETVGLQIPAASTPGKKPKPALAVPEIDLTDPNRYLSKNMIRSEPLHGCAFNGAVTMSVHIRDAVILAHAPKSCAYISYQSISSTGRRGLFERGALLPVPLSPNLEATEMGESEVIFGGMEKLEDKINEIKKRGPKAIVVISACPAGIIGDDIDSVRLLSEPDLPVVTIKTDGNMSGDYLQGMLMCYTMLAKQIIRRDVPVAPDTVNVVFEKVVAKNTDGNFRIMSEFLSQLGIGVNCRFLCDTTYDRLENFCAAPLNLLAYKDYTGKLLQDFFTREYGAVFFDMAFPVGFAETADWLRGVAGFFERPDAAEAIIAEHQARYAREVAALKPVLSGKKLMVITYNHSLDWILQTALDVGIEVVKVGILNFSQDEGFRTRLDVPLPVEENYDRDNREKDLKRYRPDILLTNYASSIADEVFVADTIPMCPDVGFYSGLIMAKRWAQLLKLNLKGEWKQDERLFRQYYAG